MEFCLIWRSIRGMIGNKDKNLTLLSGYLIDTTFSWSQNVIILKVGPALQNVSNLCGQQDA